MNGVFALGLLIVSYVLTVNRKRGRQIDFLTRQISKKDKEIANLGNKLHELHQLLDSYERR